MMTHEDGHRSRRRVVAAGIAGNVMEWYDFSVYGFFARTIGNLYFPSDDPTSSLLAAFAVFAVGLLMLLCRIVQGLAVGGEYTSSAVFLAETAHPGKRGAASAWAPFGAVAGILLGSAVGAFIMNTMPLEQVIAWGWRIPFLLGVLVGVVGFILRRRLPFDQPTATSRSPLLQALREYPVEMLQGVCLSLVNAIGFYLIFVYLITWLKLFADMGARIALQINSLNM